MGVNHVSRNGAKQAPSGGKSLTDEAAVICLDTKIITRGVITMLSEERRELITKEIEAKCEQGEVFFIRGIRCYAGINFIAQQGAEVGNDLVCEAFFIIGIDETGQVHHDCRFKGVEILGQELSFYNFGIQRAITREISKQIIFKTVKECIEYGNNFISETKHKLIKASSNRDNALLAALTH